MSSSELPRLSIFLYYNDRVMTILLVCASQRKSVVYRIALGFEGLGIIVQVNKSSYKLLNANAVP